MAIINKLQDIRDSLQFFFKKWGFSVLHVLSFKPDIEYR